MKLNKRHKKQINAMARKFIRKHRTRIRDMALLEIAVNKGIAEWCKKNNIGDGSSYPEFHFPQKQEPVSDEIK